MLIWLDILTPKQVNFLGEFGRRLEMEGHSVFRTTRRYKEVNELLEMKKIDAVSIGRHGGGSLEGKLTASSERVSLLSRTINRLKPELSIAFASPEAARTSFGLDIAHYTINDSPHSTSVARLTIPLSSKLFSPSIIPKGVWKELGARSEKIIQYNALDPVVWLKDFSPNPKVLSDLEVEASKPLLVFRVEEAKASYLMGHVSEEVSVIIPIIQQILDRSEEIPQVVVLPRYLDQAQNLRRCLPSWVTIPEKVIDGPSLLSYASVFVGAGGTMTAEAALLGTPTLSCFPREPTIVEEYLIKKGLVYRESSPERVGERIQGVLEGLENARREQRKLSRMLKSGMEDPIKVIMEEIGDSEA